MTNKTRIYVDKTATGLASSTWSSAGQLFWLFTTPWTRPASDSSVSNSRMTLWSHRISSTINFSWDIPKEIKVFIIVTTHLFNFWHLTLTLSRRSITRRFSIWLWPPVDWNSATSQSRRLSSSNTGELWRMQRSPCRLVETIHSLSINVLRFLNKGHRLKSPLKWNKTCYKSSGTDVLPGGHCCCRPMDPRDSYPSAISQHLCFMNEFTVFDKVVPYCAPDGETGLGHLDI